MRGWFSERKPGLLIHGDARGADRSAQDVCRSLGWGIAAMPATWTRPKPEGGTFYAPYAGLERNSQMVERAALAREAGHVVEVVAWHPLRAAVATAKQSGTGDCVRKAQAAGFVVQFPEVKEG